MLDVLDLPAYRCAYRMGTNACLNLLNSARSRRETYIGEWLPEPISGEDDDPEAVAERRDMLSYAYLVLLERLPSPVPLPPLLRVRPGRTFPSSPPPAAPRGFGDGC